ncbi:MAG: excinuclease ABC subunit UvrA, partial [Clostridiaceae bacterium]|nr:excinuclease ABC subunit UvrA [Clostridiaceae bacterium]
YVESLSSYARQFLGQAQKPDVDRIAGLSPAIAIDQKTTSRNPRSTVGTVTEIYDYLRLLYARVGTPHCPVCGREIERQTVDQITDAIMSRPEGTRLTLLAPLVRNRKGEHTRLLEKLQSQGFVRIRVDGEMKELDADLELVPNKKHTIEVVVDRLVRRDGIENRLADSVETALELADDLVIVRFEEEGEEGGDKKVSEQIFSQKLACTDCEISLGELSPRMFSFNNPYGACPECTGLGERTHFAPEFIVGDPGLSIKGGAIDVTGFHFTDETSWSYCHVEALAEKYGFSLKTPWEDLSSKERDLILFGNKGEELVVDTSRTRYNKGKPYHTSWEGVIPILERRYNETSSPEMKEYYHRYMRVTPCPVCKGARLRPEVLAVTVGDKNIDQATHLSIDGAHDYFSALSFPAAKADIARPVMRELLARLHFLLDVGLDYLTLARSSGTLSGGESQRIRLATQIGAGLTGVLYVLDEPSIGLHQRDNIRLLETLKNLRDLGNTVLVVEHDEETIWEADHLIDIGPGAGVHGGRIVAQGRPDDIAQNCDSITGQYLSGRKRIPVPAVRRPADQGFLTIRGARENNLKNFDLDLPLGVMTCVTGVSGSGKSSLVNNILLKKLESELNRSRRVIGKVDAVEGIDQLDKVIASDQTPIGRTPRSNPATYTSTFDLIRSLFAETLAAKQRGYKPGRFSFNVRGGRCEACSG